jgi:cytochrome P450
MFAEVSEIMHSITTRITVRGVGVEFPIVTALGKVLRFVPNRTIQDIFCPNDVLYEHGRKYLDSIKASETSSNIFSNIAAEAEAGEKLSMDDVHLEASGLIVAGTDTTSTTLTYLVWAVLSQPKLQKALEAEVAALDKDYGDTDLEKLPMLNAVIEETLRLYGAAPSGLPRSVPPGGVTINEQFIPAGSTVTTQAYTFHRDPALFPRPLE